MAKAQIPLAKNLKSAEEYFIAEANALRAVHGTPWIFVGVAVMIDYLATLEKGSRAVDRCLKARVSSGKGFSYIQSISIEAVVLARSI